MSTWSDFFLSSPSSVVQLELLEIRHAQFSKAYRIVRNAINGVTVTLETLEVAIFDYYPLRISPLGSRDNLDFGLKIDLGDLGEVIPLELDRVADGSSTKPSLTYRTYRSDVLTAPLYGPVVLEVGAIAMTREGCSFEAKAPSLNINRTGEVYTMDRFPGLRGFL